MNNSIWKIIFTRVFSFLLFCLSSLPVHANLTVDPVQSNVIIEQIITITGTTTCQFVRVFPQNGQPFDISGVVTGNTYTVTFTYSFPGTYTANVFEDGLCSSGTKQNILVPFTVSLPPTSPPPTPSPAGTPPPVTNVLSEPAGNLDITAIDLRFQNSRTNMRVEKNTHDIRAQAQLRYRGSGLVSGFWEVDNQFFSPVREYLLSGNNIKLMTPPEQPLPTYRSGVHTVRLVIEEPVVKKSPVITYRVTNVQRVNLIAPENNAEIKPDNLMFRWSQETGNNTYRLNIMDESGKTVFKALTRVPAYSIPDEVVASFLESGKHYTWKVETVDDNNRVLQVSNTRRFLISSYPLYSSGELLVQLKTGQSVDTVKKVLEKYDSSVKEYYRLRSINKGIVVVGTSGDVKELKKKLQQEGVFESVQLNRFFFTDSHSHVKEPMDDFNDLVATLHLDKLKYTGQSIKVGIIDSEVDTNHFDLKNCISKSYNLLPDKPDVAEIHGTAVAGLIAGQINGKGSRGIAPDVDLYSYRACYQQSKASAHAICTSKSISIAIDRAIRDSVNIVNMSLGSQDDDKLVSSLIDAGAQKGILFVASAGNNASQTRLSFPARYSGVISVAGVTEHGDTITNEFINRQAMVLSPAENLFTTVPEDKHSFLSGSSMSVAVVTGLISLALEKNGHFGIQDLPEKTPDVCLWMSGLLDNNLCDLPEEK